MSLQEIISKIKIANDRGEDFNPLNYTTDPKMVEYAKKLNENEASTFDYSRVKNVIHWHLNQITKISGRAFEYNEHNIPVLKCLTQYFTNDLAFYQCTKDLPEIFKNRTSLNKGILLIGGYGSGKSTIVTAFQRVGFPGKEFRSKTCPDLAENWNGKDKIYFTDNWYFDEFGHETQSQFAKKDAAPVMSKIIEERYYRRHFHSNSSTGFTIMTTNLTMDEITEKYGSRLADRIRDMFNVVLLLGDSFRN